MKKGKKRVDKGKIKIDKGRKKRTLLIKEERREMIAKGRKEKRVDKGERK